MNKIPLHIPILLIAASGTLPAATLLEDNFDSVFTPNPEGRIYDNQLDTGWKSTTGYGATHTNPSRWDVTADAGGRLQNDTNNTTSYVESETPAWQWFSNPGAGSNTDTFINISFDYGTDAADTLTVHFWAVQAGETPGSNSWITNNQGWQNGGSSQNETVSSGGNASYDLNTGAAVASGGNTYLGTPLNGTGTFNATINLNTLGLAGVSDVGDIDTFFIAFAGNETGGGTTWVDNLSITSASVPEPTGTSLLGLAGLAFILRRRKH